MERTSDSTKEEIISLKIQGFTNKEIHEKTGTSTGKVSEITNDFAAKLQINSPQDAFTFFKIIQKNSVTLDSAFENIKTGSLLKNIGISDDHASDTLTAIERESKNTELTIPEITSLAAVLGRISEDHNIKGNDLIGTVEEKVQQLETLKGKIKEAETQREESESRLSMTLKENNTTMQDIDKYTSLQKDMQDNGLDMMDLSDTVNMIKQSKNLKHDPEKIIAKIQESELLEDTISKATKQSEELAEANRKAEKEYTETVEKKNANKSMVDVIDQLGLDGVTHDELKQLHEKITEIGKCNGLSPKEAAKRFYVNIQNQYHKKTGFEQKIQLLEKTCQEQEKQSQELSYSLEQKKADYHEQEKAIMFLKRLQKNGIGHTHITSWEETIKKIGITPAQFQQNIKTLSDIQEMIQDKQDTCKDAEQRLVSLNAKERELSAQVKTLEVKRKEITNLNEIVKKATDSVMITCQKAIQEFGVDKIKDEVDSIRQEIHSGFEDVYSMEEKHAEAREDIAKADFLKPIYNIIASNDDNLERIWIPLHTLLTRLEVNVSKQNIGDHALLRNVTSLKESVCRLLLSHTQA